MIHIAIVEDDSGSAEVLKTYLNRYEQDTETPMVWTTYENGELFLEEGRRDFDLIFMDIELGGINGIEVARQIREYDHETIIVLITNLLQYAIQGYSVQAADYIVKPVSYPDFKKKMDQLSGQVERRHSCITLKSGRDCRKFTISRITYLEVYGHQLILHTEDGKEQVSGTLAQMTEMLKPYGFVKCNKCYLVNLEYVSGIIGDSVEVAGELLKISRREKTEFIHALTRFAKG